MLRLLIEETVAEVSDAMDGQLVQRAGAQNLSVSTSSVSVDEMLDKIIRGVFATKSITVEKVSGSESSSEASD